MTDHSLQPNIGNLSEEAQHEHWMREAIAEAYKAEALGEVPIGAVIVQNEPTLVGDTICVKLHWIPPPMQRWWLFVRPARPSELGVCWIVLCTSHWNLVQCVQVQLYNPGSPA